MKHVTFKIVALARANADGAHSVCLRVTFRRKSRYFFLNRKALPAAWDAKTDRFTKEHPGHKRENDMLRTYEQRASDAIRDMERDGVPFTFERFEQAVFSSSNGPSGRLTEYIEQIEGELLTAGKAGNAAAYRTLRGIIGRFKPRAALADVDAGMLSRFESWCLARGVASGGLSVYMRTLRAVCNRAIKQKVMPPAWYPFRGYSLAHLKSGKARKAAPLEFIRALESYECTGFRRLAVDLFLFSFYCRGMNFADICELTGGNIQGGRLVYKRKKTGRVYSLALNERAVAIIERNRAGRLFPVFTTAHKDEKKKLDRRKGFLKWVNEEIRFAAVELGFDIPSLSFYTARHTYANSLKLAGVPVGVIAEALGHGDVRVTDSYLKSFGDQVLDDADKLLL